MRAFSQVGDQMMFRHPADQGPTFREVTNLGYIASVMKWRYLQVVHGTLTYIAKEKLIKNQRYIRGIEAGIFINISPYDIY